MHTLEYAAPPVVRGNPDRAVVFNFNGDFSGDVQIRVDRDELTIPFDCLKAFVAEYVRREKIRRLEYGFADGVLGL